MAAGAAFCLAITRVAAAQLRMTLSDLELDLLEHDERLEAMRRLLDSDFIGPVNIGSEEMVPINQLAEIVMDIAGKTLTIKHIPGPLGVRGRSSDNRLIRGRSWAWERL